MPVFESHYGIDNIFFRRVADPDFICENYDKEFLREKSKKSNILKIKTIDKETFYLIQGEVADFKEFYEKRIFFPSPEIIIQFNEMDFSRKAYLDNAKKIEKNIDKALEELQYYTNLYQTIKIIVHNAREFYGDFPKIYTNQDEDRCEEGRHFPIFMNSYIRYIGYDLRAFNTDLDEEDEEEDLYERLSKLVFSKFLKKSENKKYRDLGVVFDDNRRFFK